MKKAYFQPKLTEPQAINNYSGASFRCFTKGDTLPFKFTFSDGAGGVPDVTDYQVWIHMSDEQAVVGGDPQAQTLLSVEIPLTDLPTGVFEGTISDSETNSLPAGLVYAQALFTNATGQSYIIDMCILEVYPAVPFDNL